MSALRLACLAGIASLAVGCGGGGQATAKDTTATTNTKPAADDKTPDRPPTVPLTGAAEQLLVLFEDLAQDVRAAGPDCAKYATAMSAWTDKNADTYVRLRGEVAQMKLPASEETRFDDRLTAAMTSVVETASSCGNNDQAWASFRKWDALMESE